MTKKVSTKKQAATKPRTKARAALDKVRGGANKQKQEPAKQEPARVDVTADMVSDVCDVLNVFAKEVGDMVGLLPAGDVTASYAKGSTGWIKITFQLDTPAGAKTQTAIDAAVTGLPKSIIGKSFAYRNRTYKITGIVANRPKNPVSVRREPDGKRFKFPAAVVQQALKGAK